jgi:thiamine biosynthesis lipoprotein
VFLIGFSAFAAQLETETPKQDAGPAPFIARHDAMGCEFSIIVYPPDPKMKQEEMTHITDAAFEAVDGLEKRISEWQPDSYTSKINEHAGERPVETTPELMQLLVHSRHYWQDSKGIFDVTVGPLVALWGFYRKEAHLPTDQEVNDARAKVGMDKVELDEVANTVHFKVPGMRLDFGGIGKGLACDRAANVLKEEGVTCALVNSGTSSVVAIGAPPGTPGWTIRIRSPYNKEEHVEELTIKDESLSTSSGSENFFEIDGKRYCHIFDPRTGKPVEGRLSGTSIAPTGEESDALSKVFFVLDIESAKAYCASHPKVRAVVLVLDNGAVKPVRINFQG